MICESINVKVQVDDGVIIAVQNGCEVRVYIDLDTPILVGAFDWPPELDLLSTRVKQLEDNPATITVDNHLDDVSLNPVQNRTLWQIVQDIWAAINEFLQAIPTKVGQLQNDSGYITINDVPDSIFNQVGTEIKPIDPTATLDASFIANLPDPALDDTVTEESTKGVKSSGIWNAIEAVKDTFNGVFDLVFSRLRGESAGTITKDENNNIESITTFGETTVFNRDVNGNIESWENDTHIWNLTKENGEITGWTLTEKP